MGHSSIKSTNKDILQKKSPSTPKSAKKGPTTTRNKHCTNRFSTVPDRQMKSNAWWDGGQYDQDLGGQYD